MADILTYTPQPIRVTNTAAVQPRHTAVDVLPYAFLDVEIVVVGWEGTLVGAQIIIGIWTGLQNEVDDAWIAPAGSTVTLTPTNPAQILRFNGNFLRYSRWFVSSSGWGAQTAAEFFIRGAGRRRGEP